MTDVVLIDCTNCGGPNHPARQACGRCRTPIAPTPRPPSDEMGATDATQAMDGVAPGRPASADDTPPVPAKVRPDAPVGARVVDLLLGTTAGDTQPLDPIVPPTVEARSLRIRPVIAVTVVGLLLGVVVGVAGAVSVSRRSADLPVTVAQATFDPSTYDEGPVALDIETATATSFLPSTGENRYEPTLVLDGDATTAWNSDGSVRDSGIGEVLTVHLAEPSWVTAIEVANGYQKDDVRFLANARIARVQLVFDDGSRVSVVLLDQPGRQRVPLPSPALTTSVRFEVVEAFRGDTYADLAVSELVVFGHEAVGADRTRAQQLVDDAN